MKRENKFRAWDKINNQWIYSNVLDIGKYKDLIDPKKICEFTGLKDRNGKEIYEGDILEWPHRKAKDKRVIEYIDNGFWIHGIRGFEMPAEHLREIIGNIHENPELI